MTAAASRCSSATCLASLGASSERGRKSPDSTNGCRERIQTLRFPSRGDVDPKHIGSQYLEVNEGGRSSRSVFGLPPTRST